MLKIRLIDEARSLFPTRLIYKHQGVTCYRSGGLQGGGQVLNGRTDFAFLRETKTKEKEEK